jgi:predicted metal-dependent hydrolase
MIAKNHNIKYGKKEISFELIFQDRKTLGIKVYPEGTVKVFAPTETTNEKIKEKVKEKARWILKQQDEFLSYQPSTPARKYINGETHLYLGRQYILHAEKGQINQVKVYRGNLLVQHKTNTKVETVVKNWYREKALEHFTSVLEVKKNLFTKYEIEKPSIEIRSMSKRWGSCTVKGKVILNPDLIKAPKGSIEYVMIHELCHLVHHNHTKAFYELQEKIMPDWKKWKTKLEYCLV